MAALRGGMFVVVYPAPAAAVTASAAGMQVNHAMGVDVTCERRKE